MAAIEFRPFVKKFYYYTLLALFLSELVVIRLNLSEVTKSTMLESVFGLLVASTVPLSIFVRLYFFIRPRLFAEIDFENDKVRVKFKNRLSEINLVNVSVISFTFLPPRFFGGFSLTMSNGKKVTFLSLVEGSEKILQKVLEMHPGKINKEKAAAYINESRQLEDSWRRLRQSFLRWKVLVLKLSIVPVLFLASIKLKDPVPPWIEGQYINVFLAVFSLNVFVISSLFQMGEKYLLKAGMVDTKIEEKVKTARNVGYVFLAALVLFLFWI